MWNGRLLGVFFNHKLFHSFSFNIFIIQSAKPLLVDQVEQQGLANMCIFPIYVIILNN